MEDSSIGRGFYDLLFSCHKKIMKESSLKDGLSWLRCDDDDTVPLGGKSRALAERAMDFIVTMVRNPRQLKFRHLVAFLV